MPLGAHKVALFGVAGVSTGSAVLLETAVASDDASIEFTLPTAYKQVKFGFNVTPATDGAILQFQVNASDDVGGDFDESLITSTFFHAHQKETGTDATLEYRTGSDQAQGTGYQHLVSDSGTGNDADQSCAGELFLFSPQSTVYVKHFYARTHNYMPHPTVGHDWATDAYVGGYINNAASAISEISFKMSSGNIDDGTIKMWGIK